MRLVRDFAEGEIAACAARWDAEHVTLPTWSCRWATRPVRHLVPRGYGGGGAA